MNQRTLMTFGLIALTAVLVGLNLLAYRQKPGYRDDERNPNRSTYNSGTSGTRALFAVLEETGRNVLRWERPVAELRSPSNASVSTFVVIGRTPREFTPEEAKELYGWVESGGRLVVVDREPPETLRRIGRGWSLWLESYALRDPMSASGSQEAEPALPQQPSGVLRGVHSVQPSVFGGGLKPDFVSDDRAPSGTAELAEGDRFAETPGPVALLSSGEDTILVEAGYGLGSLAYLSDPYIVSNAGIMKLDNARLAVNLLTIEGGTIAFDEYHHGYTPGNDRLVGYLAGTPALPMLLQLLLVTAVVLGARSVRFARPLPERPDSRGSKLEYVAAMAELQRRTGAYDIAVENAYRDFRRRMGRMFGVDSKFGSTALLAEMMASQLGERAEDLVRTFVRCEEIINGDATAGKETLALVREIRRVEQKLRS